MGMFDVVVFEMEMPGFQGRRFQTKNLDRCLDLFAITKAGRLCLAGSEFMEDVEKPEIERVDIDYHGDIRLVAEEGDEEYTARFTHGTLDRCWHSVRRRQGRSLEGAAKKVFFLDSQRRSR